jgi:glycosyltransferase involved in cell wall biosynthesis
MSRKTILFRGPVKTLSGYGAHSRDILKSLYDIDLYDIKIDSCGWGNTPLTALNEDDLFHQWIESNIITQLDELPEIYIQVTVPNEFQRKGKYNIGITAGIETTAAPKSWVDGINRMDKVITSSTFSKDVLYQTVYNETDKVTGKLIKQHKITTPIEVLHEGVDTSIYFKEESNIKLDLKEDFNYLFVGHWLRGKLGQDRKDVGMLIKCFCESFKDGDDRPGLILKTSGATFSIKQREYFREKIKEITDQYTNPPSIYLLFGQLSDDEMNELYNHPKVKSMVTLTKGEGFGRPLLEFSMSGKPIIASNWSGHKDFLPMDKAIMLGGKLTQVDESASDDFILKNAKWFTSNYNEVVEVLKIVKEDYETFLERSEELRIENSKNFSLETTTIKLKEILESVSINNVKPTKTNLVLPELKKIEK